MKAAKKTSGGAVALLNELIPEAVSISAQIGELQASLKAKHEAIKITMADAELERYAAADGSEALIIEAECLTWNVDKLEKELPTTIFEAMCPRKPNGTELRKLCEIDATSANSKAIRACAKAKKQKRLEVRAPGANEKATNEIEAAREAAA